MICKLFLCARLSNVGEWKAILNAIGDIVEEAMFVVNTDGISFRGMDPAHVALLDITFPKSSFDHFESQTSFFGIRTDDLKTIFNTAANTDIVELKIEDEGFIKVSVTGSLNMEYNLRLIQKQEVNTPIPKIECNAKVSLEPNTLSRIILNIERISEYLTINCNQKGLEFSGQSDIGNGKISLDKESTDLIKHELSQDSLAEYSLEYMGKIIRSIGKASKIVNMEYADKKLLHLLFEMPSNAKAEYYLAPRIKD